MSTGISPRQLLADADRERSIERGADALMVRLRLGEKPIQAKRTGLIGWWRDRGTAPDAELMEVLPSNQMDAMYRALQQVRREAKAKADSLEALVVTASSEREGQR